ncbi:lysophospholipid acyltransferase family protein [Dyadobacter chenwenxiniae]|uniref:Lysophospholipid acyltransferase family protein n=1 Tax=Dyadobacter chenwenxiniae TaxID=2906456 RepID=A0A9X1TBX7_9BACT|nr:lysophospholipid acyltransferase family protein [Dyadobacter chenwenxiniae]MCF0060326.1 lysophospholipid acyltransferase family protein [Dyadobacter chenwenxiniae]UON86059.1 lysophospholipid acyltransferase family protein [Dyadobacter chenwenxiniae]
MRNAQSMPWREKLRLTASLSRIGSASLSVMTWRLFSHLIYLIFKHIWAYRKKVILKNLAICFPAHSENENAQLADKYYRHLASLIVEPFIVRNIAQKDLAKFINYANPSLIHQLLSERRDIVLMVSHYGNWEYLFSMPLITDSSVLAAYSPVSNGLLNEKLKRLRSRFGIKLIPKANWYRSAVNWRESKPTIFINVADQRPPVAGKNAIEFFGNHTYIQSGAARIAIKRNSAVVYLDVHKRGANKYQFRFNLLVKEAGGMQETEIMKLYYTALEKNIRRQPELWLWSHNRWKFGFCSTLPSKNI